MTEGDAVADVTTIDTVYGPISGGNIVMSDNAIVPPVSDLEDVTTAWGVMPRWKARAMALAEMQTVIRESVDRSDGIIGPEVTPLTEEQQPPPLAADASTTSRARLSDEDLKQIEAAVDALDQRLSALEARRRAENALLDAEAEIERELEKLDPSSDDDIATMH
jgi:hypothetical protein